MQFVNYLKENYEFFTQLNKEHNALKFEGLYHAQNGTMCVEQVEGKLAMHMDAGTALPCTYYIPIVFGSGGRIVQTRDSGGTDWFSMKNGDIWKKEWIYLAGPIYASIWSRFERKQN